MDLARAAARGAVRQRRLLGRGPLTLIGISPRSEQASSPDTPSLIAHGTMLNPIPASWAPHGFDSRIGGYNEALNVARNNGAALSADNPRTVPAGSSLCSCTSRLTSTTAEHARLADFAVLTVVDVPPPPGSFRPPYQGTDKTPRWNEPQLDYSILQRLPRYAMEAPSAAAFTRPWVELSLEYNSSRDFHAFNNQPEYDRDLSWAISSALLQLHQDYENDDKRLAYVRKVQYGIVVYGELKYGVDTINGRTLPGAARKHRRQGSTGPRSAGAERR